LSFERLFGGALVVGSLAAAFAIRLVTGSMLESTGELEQITGTAFYASAVYGGVVLVRPRLPAALLSLAFCWAVEFFQLTGIPAGLSARSVVARLVLGQSFDPQDLIWYVVGVALAALLFRLHSRLCRRIPA
jgi:hypothetical protein